MSSTEKPETGVETTSVGDVDTEEAVCEEETEATLDGRAAPADEQETLTPEQEAELDEMLEKASSPGTKAAPPGLGPRGGGFGGTEAPARLAMAIGTRNGLTVTSTKRSSGSTGSDHHTSQQRSFAADLSNGSNPTPQMDRTAREIATLLGHPEFQAGNLRISLHGYRVQMLYRTHIGGNHFNHVHVGVRAL
jgi:hypothetical protein